MPFGRLHEHPTANWAAAERVPEGTIYCGRERRQWNSTRRRFEVVAVFCGPNGSEEPLHQEFG
jgi:hypothetical protein